MGRDQAHMLAGMMGPTPEQIDVAKKLERERRRGEARMAYQFANLHMPEDIRQRARAWGMEAFITVLWNNAFQAGWREAERVKQMEDVDHD